MKFKLLLFFSISVIMIVLTGCPYESKVSLSDSKDSSIDPDIIGKWLLKSGTQGRWDTLIIMQFNHHEYYFETHELKNGKPLVGRGRAFITCINHDRILNLCDLTDPAKFFFVKYVISGNKMITYSASDQYIKEKFSSSRELFTYFKAHFGKQGFFEAADTLFFYH